MALPSAVPAAAAGAAPGPVYAWGFNGYGELGNGTTTESPTSAPVEAKLPAGVTATAVAGGTEVSYALTSTGAVYAWGTNNSGQLGDGNTTNSDVPVLVDLPAGVTATAIAAGNTVGLAVTSTGAVYQWGFDPFPPGGGATVAVTPTIVPLPAGVQVTAVAAGNSSEMALTSTGAVYAWGNNGSGQIGNGTSSAWVVTPVQVPFPGGTSITAISSGGTDSGTALALTSTGTVYAWGDDASGQVGNGTVVSSGCDCVDSPTVVSLPAGAVASAIAAGSYQELVVTNQGVYAWGANFDG